MKSAMATAQSSARNSQPRGLFATRYGPQTGMSDQALGQTTRSNCDESEEFHPSRMAGTRLKIRPQSPSYLTTRRRSPVFAGIAVEEQSVSVTERSGIIIVALSLLYLPLPASSPCAESFSAARTLARHRDLRAPSRDHVSGCSTLDENRQRGAGSKSLGFTSP
jgi:hypothetical protein